MANVKDITSMCKSGNVHEAYELAKNDLSQYPTDIWQQRSVGWALYYLIKENADKGDIVKLLEHLDELKSLDLLTVSNDNMIYDNVQIQIASFVKNHMSINDVETPAKLSAIFVRLKDFTFNPSLGHSLLLQSFIKFDFWLEMVDFLDWWNLDNLTNEDYTPYVTPNGQKMLTIAERALIANSKALLKSNDLGRIELFLPRLDNAMNTHPEFTYTGYYYGKLLLKFGSDEKEELKVIVPFVRKKATEFWVWQLLSEVYTNNSETQLACLLRAVHCKTQESFLGKVRIKIADLYINQNLFDNAKFHIEKITQCYLSQGWRLPNEVNNWISQPWFITSTPNDSDQINFMEITNAILCEGTEEAIGVVTYVDPNSQKSFIVYGNKLKVSHKVRFKVNPGNVLKINFLKDSEGRIKILNAQKVELTQNLSYAKFVEGTIDKQEGKNFAFLKTPSGDYFISPNVVQKHQVKNNDKAKAFVIYDYDKKKEAWNWACVRIIK